MQSGAGWCEKSYRIQADEALWDNLVISLPKIGKFKKNAFPLFDSLGDLYDGQIAEGTYNFTSTSQPPQIAGEFEDAKDFEEVPSGSENDGVQILHKVPPQMREDVKLVNEGVDTVKHNAKKLASGPKKKPPQELKKPKNDEMVQVVDRYVKMKEKKS